MLVGLYQEQRPDSEIEAVEHHVERHGKCGECGGQKWEVHGRQRSRLPWRMSSCGVAHQVQSQGIRERTRCLGLIWCRVWTASDHAEGEDDKSCDEDRVDQHE